MNIQPYSMRKAFFRLLCAASAASSFLTACQEEGFFRTLSGGGAGTSDGGGAVVRELVFSGDLRTVTAKIDQTADFGRYSLDDTSMVRVRVTDFSRDYGIRAKRHQPEVVNLVRSGCEALKERNVNLLAVMDMSLDRTELDRQRGMLEKMRHTYCMDNMFLTFMLPGGETSPIYSATGYVLDTYTSPLTSPLMNGTPEDSHSYLYKSLCTILDRISSQSTASPLDTSAFTSIVVFSGSRVYDEDTNLPYDPEHYVYQENLIRMVRDLPSNIEVSFIGEGIDAPASGVAGVSEIPDINILRMLCQGTGGIYMADFSWEMLKEHIRHRFDINISDFEVELRNAEGQFYIGKLSGMSFSFLTGEDSLLTVASKDYTLGILEPMAVGTLNRSVIVNNGLLQGVLLMVLAFLIFQFAVPWVGYFIFRRKYVVRYTGPNMTVNEVAVPEKCHLCRAPFRKDDRVVVKCAHVVHWECWEENDCSCPEYGLGCQEGSHFYDRHNLLNVRNTSFYLKWILAASAVALLSWLLFVLSFNILSFNHLDALYEDIFTRMGSAFSITDQSVLLTRCYILPIMACHLCFFLTAALSIMTVHKRVWYLRAADILARTVTATAAVLAVFLLYSTVVILSHLKGDLTSLTFIPWMAASIIVAVVSSWHTRIRPGKKYVMTALAVGFFGSFVWRTFSGIECQADISHLLMAYFFFSIGIAVSIAGDIKRHERFFLHTSGPVKEMDIALYKWFSQKKDASVSIGRSVDCSIQITWDIKSQITPVQAEIRLVNGDPCLYAIDGAVSVGGRALPYRKPVRLYHNDTFVIGLTTFRYVEI